MSIVHRLLPFPRQWVAALRLIGLAMLVTGLLTAGTAGITARTAAAAGTGIWYVNGSVSASGDCATMATACKTVHDALAKAQLNDVILIAGANGSFNGVYCEQLAIDTSLSLVAVNAADPPTIDGGGGSGNGCASTDAPGSPVLTLGDTLGTTMYAVVQGLTIQHGDASSSGNGGGILVYSGATLDLDESTVSDNGACTGSCTLGGGGGIYSRGGSVDVYNSSVTGNSACTSTGCSGTGGGIYNRGGTLLLEDSTVSGNAGCAASTCTGYDGGIHERAGSTQTLVNSTVATNMACDGSGCTGTTGGVGIYTNGTLTLVNSTISGNTACSPSGSCTAQTTGGIANQGGTVTLSNTILAGNSGPAGSPDCSGTLADGSPDGTTVGHNIVGIDAGCSGLTNGDNNDQVGPINNTPIDPKLAPVANNGGWAPTMALLPNSPAGGAGDPGTCALAQVATGIPGPDGTDERGEPRPTSTCDIGAYQAISTIYVAPNGNDSNGCLSAGAPCQHVQTGVRLVAPDGTVHVAAGTYCEQVVVDHDESIDGAASGGTSTVIDGGGPQATDAAGTNSNPCATANGGPETAGQPVVTVGDAGGTSVNATLQRLTIQHGDASQAVGNGGGIDVFSGASLRVVDSSISDNTACALPSCVAGHGGGIYVSTGATVDVENSVISGNTGCNSSCVVQGDFTETDGGGVSSYGTLTINGSTISGNTACESPSFACPAEGAGVSVADGMATVSDSTISHNTVCDGPSRNCFGGGAYESAPLTLIQDTVSANLACIGAGCFGGGGGISTDGGSLDAINSTVADNTGCVGNSCDGDGGGIYDSGESTMGLINTTVAANTACTGSSCTGYVGGLYSQNATPAQLANTILAGNSDNQGSPDCDVYSGENPGGLSDSTPAGSGSGGHNIIGIDASCGLINGVNGDIVGTSAHPIDPHLNPLANNGGGARSGPQTMAPGPNSPAIGAGDTVTCQAPTITDPTGTNVPGPGAIDQRGVSRNLTTRRACDTGAYDTAGAIPLTKGWNLIDLQLQDPSSDSAAGLAGSIDTQLGSRTVSAIATYGAGRFTLYVPGYSTDQTLTEGQGMFLLSTKTGAWLPPGNPPSAPSINLQPGWNLVGAPVPYTGLDGTRLDSELDGMCGLQEAVMYTSGSYSPYLAGWAAPYHVPSIAGMWLACTKASIWTPS